MAPFDVNAGLADISPDEPAGPNLEFDPAFSELERLAQGKPEQQYGSTIVPAEEPDWKAVVAGAWDLLERSYDLRILALLGVGRLQREGVPGYAETLGVILELLRTRWAEVHPQLDPEDDNDPTLRANALLALAEPGRVLRFLRTMPMARSPRAGSVCWRDIAISTGALEVDDSSEKMSEATIRGAFRETDPAGLATLREALASAIASAVAIPKAFEEAAGYGTGPDYDELLKLLRDMVRMANNYAPAEDDAGAAEEAVAAPDEGGTVSAPPRAAAGGAVNINSLGPINNRADAVRLLDLVVSYYERNEPSSPLPLLINRARRLADKGFIDILRDLAPDGVSQAERIAGTTEY
jgi:type VI secretion system protein ImpA